MDFSQSGRVLHPPPLVASLGTGLLLELLQLSWFKLGRKSTALDLNFSLLDCCSLPHSNGVVNVLPDMPHGAEILSIRFLECPCPNSCVTSKCCVTSLMDSLSAYSSPFRFGLWMSLGYPGRPLELHWRSALLG